MWKTAAVSGLDGPAIVRHSLGVRRNSLCSRLECTLCQLLGRCFGVIRHLDSADEIVACKNVVEKFKLKHICNAVKGLGTPSSTLLGGLDIADKETR
jgi:hypothetical protein